MRIHRLIIVVVIIATQLVANLAQAEDASETIKLLLKRIEELEKKVERLENKPPLDQGSSAGDKDKIGALEEKVKILDRQRELDQENAAEKSKSSPVVSVGQSGLQVRSADSNFVFKARGYVQADARFYAGDNSAGTANDTFLLRRVRPIFEGTVYDKFDYRIMLDFGANTSATSANIGNNGMLQDAYLTARLWPEFQIQAGKFKEPVGLERLQSGANLLFVERGYPTQLVPNRDVGVQLQGELFSGTLNYAAGVFNGVANGGSADIEIADDDKDVAGRLFARPFKNSNIGALRGFGIGVAGTYGNQDGALRTFVSPGQQRFFGYRIGLGTNDATANIVADGRHWRVSPQGYYYWGPFGLFGEFVVSDQKVRRDAGDSTFASIRNTGWQVAASYILTGEENSFQAITPRKPFSLGGDGWGAWEVTGRVGQLTVDDDAFPLFANPAISAREATSWGVGLNWHLNRNFKVNLNYEQTDFKGGDNSPLNAKGEKVILTRAQISF
jgi:phosphate-selective porin OprO/OprP